MILCSLYFLNSIVLKLLGVTCFRDLDLSGEPYIVYNSLHNVHGGAHPPLLKMLTFSYLPNSVLFHSVLTSNEIEKCYHMFYPIYSIIPVE